MSEIKLKKTPFGYEYTSPLGHRYHVVKRSYQIGAKYDRRRVTEYYAYEVSTRTTVARGVSMDSFKKRFSKFLEDYESGAVRAPYHYGVML